MAGITVVAGLAANNAMGLAANGIGGGGGRSMTADAEGNRSHGMAMGMVVEVGAIAIIMAVQACIASHMADSATAQQSGRVGMTGNATAFMGLTAGGVWSAGGGMAVDTECARDPHVVGIGMRWEIISMAGLAVPTAVIAGRATGWHVDSGAVGCLQRGICVMAVSASIMDLAIQRVDRRPSRTASRGGMTRDTASMGRYHGSMIAAMIVLVTWSTTTINGVDRIMMKRPYQICHGAMAIGAGAGARGVAHYCCTIIMISGLPNIVAGARVDVTEIAVIAVDLTHHHLGGGAMTVGTVA